jgi:hypothetical protein
MNIESWSEQTLIDVHAKRTFSRPLRTPQITERSPGVEWTFIAMHCE